MQMFICIINHAYQEVTHLVSKTNSNCIEYDIYSHNTALKMYFTDIWFHLEFILQGISLHMSPAPAKLTVQAANV